jgi:fluoroquinolone transport system permease protein
MDLWKIYRSAGPVDAKNVRRDDLLAWVVGTPIVLAVILRFGVPALGGWLRVTWAFDLRQYDALFMGFYLLMSSSMVGMIVGFLLLDERDEGTLTALAVTPMPLAGYIIYRLTLPLLAGFVVTLAGYPLAGLAPIAPGALAAVALVAALNAPVVVLSLAAFAENKVSGFALVKVLNTVSMLPVAAWFIDMPWQIAAGLVPGYWPMKMLWQASAGREFMVYGAAGTVVTATVAGLLLRRFVSRVHRHS